MKALTRAETIALIPAATPHGSFSPDGVFHPLTLLDKYDPGKPIDEKTAYSGYPAIKMGSMASDTIVVTVPTYNSLWKATLGQLVADFVDPASILTEADIVEVDEDKGGGTIAGQVTAAFEAYKGANRVFLIWPYQVVHKTAPFAVKADGCQFTFTHHNLNVSRNNVPECVVLASEEKGAENEIVCKDAMSYAELDDMLKPEYTRVLSTVEIKRDEWFAFFKDRQDGRIQDFLKQTLKGKRGVCMNYRDFNFI